MESSRSIEFSRRGILGLAAAAAGLLLAGCAQQPQQPPAPGSWQEDYLRRKEKHRKWGEGVSNH
jgi:hypothetical protein